MKKFLLLSISLFISINVSAQDHTRFQGEVDALNAKEFNIDPGKEVVVFTGSSSIRMWKDVQDFYPDINAINTGFGGSHFSDLFQYLDELIFRFDPDKVFIYEGDNDVAGEKKPIQILLHAAMVYGAVKTKLPDAEIYFISPKPSISRWHLKDTYEETNSLLRDFCNANENLNYIDVWNPMLNGSGEPMSDIFIEDDLHMNAKGYQIWGKVIGEYLK